ncbi:putative membrane protein [Alkalibacillus filiformis]|uniref:Membrane protein n=1 Tax=Alkalibacillus filiformis TaxID=200990 RepID=A0ABU0DS88_9BACI|nr:SRPBCC family protein [Alkalibacillus filiformis]MDQ0351319.1 putative membrane protein [Alkalibacillus filiformis]
MSFTRSITIDAPIDQVFRVISRYEYAVEKLDHIIDLKLNQDKVTEGTKMTETRHIKGQNVNNTWEVIEYEPNQRFVVKSEQNKLYLTYRYTFVEHDGQTTVNFDGNITTSGLRNLIYKPLIKKIIIKEDGEHLNKVKAYIEELNESK